MLRSAHSTAARTTNYILSGVIVVLAAAFLVAIFTGTAMAMERMQGSADILSGKITAVDSSHPTKSITLQSQSTSEPTMNIFVTGQTEVKMCKAEKPLKDVKVGSNAQVTYHELGGVAVADSIYTHC